MKSIEKYKGILLAMFGTLLAVLLLSSCQSSTVYSESKNIEDGKWAYADSLNFNFEILDTNKLYDVILYPSYNQDEYGFENIYIKTFTSFPNNMRIDDILSLELRTSEAIKATTCNGSKCTLPIYLQSGISFQDSGKYQLTLVQNSRNPILKGVIGFELKVSIKD